MRWRHTSLALSALSLPVCGCLWTDAPDDRVRPVEGESTLILTRDAKNAHLPVAGVTIHSSYGAKRLDTATTDEDGRAALRVAEGGEITAAVVTSSQQVALTLGAIEPGREYALLWPFSAPAPVFPPWRELSVTLAEPAPVLGAYARAGFCFPMSIYGTSGTLLVRDECTAPNGSYFVYATYNLDPENHARQFVAAGTTAVTLSFISEPQARVLVEAQLPAGLANPDSYSSEVFPLHLSTPIAIGSRLGSSTGRPRVTDSLSLDHFVHLADADQLFSYLELWQEDGVLFQSTRLVPFSDSLLYDDLASEVCPFEMLEGEPGESFLLRWSNACQEGSGLYIGVAEGNAQWLGVYSPEVTSAAIPPIPGLVFTSSATVGASFRRHDPPLRYDDPAVWESMFPPTAGIDSMNSTRQGTHFSY